MERGRFILFSVISAVSLIAAIVVILVYLNMSTETAEVHLPKETAGVSSGVSSDDGGEDKLNTLVRAELRPDTVQYILEIIEKPKSYSCNYEVESFWDDDSAFFDVGVYVHDEVFSVYQLHDSYLKRCVFTDEKYYIWYVGDTDCYKGVRGNSISEEKIEDAVQMSGSYKDLLELDPERILATEYVEAEGVYCIYVKAQMGELGYISEYFIYPDTGLLLKNEIYDGDKLIYRMKSKDIMLSVPEEEYFNIPGGNTGH